MPHPLTNTTEESNPDDIFSISRDASERLVVRFCSGARWLAGIAGARVDTNSQFVAFACERIHNKCARLRRRRTVVRRLTLSGMAFFPRQCYFSANFEMSSGAAERFNLFIDIRRNFSLRLSIGAAVNVAQ